MKAVLQSFILSKTGQVPARLDEVLEAFKEVYAPKKTVLVEVGHICKHVYFIVEGCLKISTYNRNGEESTTSLSFEQDWRTAMSSFIHQKPSNERIICVENCQLLCISKDQFERLSAEIPTFESIYKGILEESYARSVERIQMLMSLDALDRLKWVLEEHPLLFTRLSNRLIASYLGISESTLSRLKSKL